MPISVGNGQQIAPNQPRSRRRKSKSGGGFTRALGLDVNQPRPVDPFGTKAKGMGRRAARIKAQSPRARYERSVRNTPAARRGRQMKRREAAAAQPPIRELTRRLPSLAPQRREADRQVRRALAALPNPTRLLQVPKLPSYTEAQKDYIIREQARRLRQIAREQGVSVSRAHRFVVDEDVPQVELVARLVRERQRGARRVARRGRRRYARELRRSGRSEAEVRRLLAVPRARARPGKAPSAAEQGMGALASVLPATLRGDRLANSLAQLAAVGSARAELAAPMVRDAVSIVRDTPAALYETGRAGVRAAQGDFEPAKRLAEAQLEGVIGHVIRGDFEGAARYAGEHPLLAILEVSGGKAAVGRGSGAVARSGALGRGAKRAARLDRAPLRDAYGRVVEERRYSPDLINKGVQVAGERLARRKGRDPDVVSGFRQTLASNRAVDEFTGMAEAQRRTGRQLAVKRAGDLMPRRPVPAAARRVGVRGRRAPEADVLSAVVEGRVDLRSLAPDLRRERVRLEAAYRANRTSMSSEARRANREQVRAIDRVLRDPRALTNVRGLREAAGKYRAASQVLESELVRLGLLDSDQAVIAKIRPYAISKMGARVVDGRVVDADGVPLSPQQVLSHMREAGVQVPAFVSHRLDTRGARSFFVNWFARRQTADAHRRTGKATELGAHDASFQALAEQHVRQQGIVDSVRSFDSFVGRFGLKRRDGGMYTWAEAQRLAADPAPLAALDSHGNPVPGYQELVPVRVVPARYSDATKAAVADLQDASRLPDFGSLVEQRLTEALGAPEGRAAQARNVVLVPAQEVQRFMEHQLKGSSVGAKLGQALTGVFRSTVLPFSAKWYFGNAAEAAIRLAMVGASPRDVPLGRKVVRALEAEDAKAAAQFRARTQGGLMWGGMQRLAVHRTADDFSGSILAPAAGAAGTARRLPVVKQALDGLRGFTEAAFALNRGIEQIAQHAAVGKHARQQMQEVSGSWLQAVRHARPALDDVVKGLTGTPAQVRYARYIDETLGKYNRFSPSMRRVFQAYAPFLPWYLNSLRFVTWTLPAKHPIKLALIANVQQAIEADLAEGRRGLPPGDLQQGVPLPNGGILPIARFTPWGAFGTTGETATQMVLPQISGPAANLAGRSWTGRPLRKADGSDVTEGDRLLIALNSFAESVVPGLAIARRAREGGETAQDDSTAFSPKTKPGTKGRDFGFPLTLPGPRAVDRIVNPLRPYDMGGGARRTVAREPVGDPLDSAIDQALNDQAAGMSAAEQRAFDAALDRALSRVP